MKGILVSPPTSFGPAKEARQVAYDVPSRGHREAAPEDVLAEVPAGELAGDMEQTIGQYLPLD